MYQALTNGQIKEKNAVHKEARTGTLPLTAFLVSIFQKKKKKKKKSRWVEGYSMKKGQIGAATSTLGCFLFEAVHI